MNFSGLFDPAHETVSRDAIFSDCARYRYLLKRWWDDSLPWVCWIMLNPSTADAAKDDPTIRKCMGFARAWGMGGIMVVNLFAWRATDPRELTKIVDPAAIGPKNAWWTKFATEQCAGSVIAAWGNGGALHGHADRVRFVLNEYSVRLSCLGITKEGHPKHPLYLPYTTPLIDFALPSSRKLGGDSSEKVRRDGETRKVSG